MNNCPAIQEIRAFHEEHGLYFRGWFKAAGPARSSDQFFPVLSALCRRGSAGPVADLGEYWEGMLPFLAEQGVLPLMHWRINELPPSLRPPPRLRPEIAMAYLESRMRQGEMETQLREMILAFQAEGKEVLVLKGPAFARYLYPEPAWRPSQDLDLLVRPGDVPACKDILARLGYEDQTRQYERRRDLTCEDTFSHRGGGRPFPVELHWALSQFHRRFANHNLDSVFEQSMEIPLPGLAFRTMGPQDALIFTATHLIWNHYSQMRLIWIYDACLLAGYLAERGELGHLQQRCAETRTLLPMRHTLTLAGYWAGLQLPRPFDDPGSWPEPAPGEVTAFNLITNRHRSLAAGLKLRLANPDISLSGKARLLWLLIFPPADLIIKHYPPKYPWLLPMSYLKRWLRWLRS